MDGVVLVSFGALHLPVNTTILGYKFGDLSLHPMPLEVLFQS